MKKVILIAAAFMLSVAGLYAQDKEKTSDFSLGIKGGFNYSNQVSNKSDYKTDYIPGFNVGVTANVPIVGPLSFAPELLLSSKGYKNVYNNAVTGNTTATTRTLNIDAPLLANFKVTRSFNVQVGPQVSFLLDTKNTVAFANGATFTSQQSNDAENKDTYRGSVLSGVVGASYSLNRNVDIHVRYALDLQKNNKDGSSSDPKYKNQVAQVGIGFRF